MNKIFNIIKSPRKIIIILASLNFFNFLNDKAYLKMMYWCFFGKKINLKNPVTFNEKIQWLKLYDRDEKYTTMVDKIEAKKYVSSIIGEEYIIPTLGEYEKFNDIDFSKLPDKFVIKCTHDSGRVVICDDVKRLDINNAKKIINKSLKREYYYWGREWPYKNVKPRIIVEEYMGSNIMDYKIFCFNGKPEFILMCTNRDGRFKNTDFYDFNWNHMEFTREKHENNPNGIRKPKNLEIMFNIAKALSKNIPFVRVDLYDIKGKVFFGELTFSPSSGYEGFKPKEWDEKLGNLIELKMKGFK